MRNVLEIDGRVQTELTVSEDGLSGAFIFSAPAGLDYKLKGDKRLNFTYIRVVVFSNKLEKLKKDLKVGKFIRIYGQLDSEKYITANEKSVFNKVIVTDKIVELSYDDDRDCYEEYLPLC